MAVLAGRIRVSETEERKTISAGRQRPFVFQRDLKRHSVPKWRVPVHEATPAKTHWNMLFPCVKCLGTKALGVGYKALVVLVEAYLRGLRCYDTIHTLHELTGILTAVAIHFLHVRGCQPRLSGIFVILVGIASLAVAAVAPMLFPRFSRRNLLVAAFFIGFIKAYVVCWTLRFY